MLSVCLFSSFSDARQIKRLSKDQRNANCYLLANGPSLANEIEINQAIFKSNDIFALNYFSNSDYFYLYCPKYYILLDPNIFMESDPETILLIDNFNRITWKMILFIPVSQKKSQLLSHIKNTNLKIFAFNATRVVGGMRFQNFFYRNNLGVPSSRNVTIPAILLMINLHYKNIYLYGVDNSWTRNFEVDLNNNKIFLNDGHFYESKNIRYFEKGMYKQWLIWIAEVLEGHEQLQKYSVSSGAKVINKSKGSFLDAYDFE